MRTICKRTLSMCVAMIFIFTTFCFADLGWSALASLEQNPVVGGLSPTITFYAPEAIYLDPTTANRSTYNFRYFIDCDASGTLRRNARQTTGTVFFSIAQACTAVSMTWEGAEPSYYSTGEGSTYTWTITGGTTTVRRGTATVTIAYTLATGGTYSVSRKVYLYMPRTNATVGVGGTFQYKTTIGNEPVTSATVLLAGLHKVGGGSNSRHSMWTGTSTTAADNTWPVIAMPSTQPSSSNGEWPSGSAYEATYFSANTGYNHDEGDGYSASLNSSDTTGGGVRWCGRIRENDTDVTLTSGITGQITVDSSRHVTMDTIPFLQGGWFVHYNTYSGDGTGAQFVSTDGGLRVGPASQQPFHDAMGRSYPTYGATPWHMTGTTPTSSTTLTMRGAFQFKRSSSSSVRLYLNFDLKIDIVDKGSLRTALNKAISKGYCADQLSVAGWSAKVTALNTQILNACETLGDPEATASQVSSALSNLTNAASNCETTAEAYAPVSINSDVANMRGAVFYVPETIYLDPTNNTTGQYFYGVTTKGRVDSANTEPSAHTSAKVYWSMPGATNVKITAKLSANDYTSLDEMTSYAVGDSDISSMTIGDTTRGTAIGNTISGTGWTATAASNGTTTYDQSLTAITLASAVTAGSFKFIEWTAEYTYGGAKYWQVAYTAVYAPNRNVTAMGVTGFDYNSDEAYASGLIYIQGAQHTNEASAVYTDTSSDHRLNYQNVSGTMLDPMVNGVSAPYHVNPYAYGSVDNIPFAGATKSFATCHCVRSETVDGNGNWVIHIDCNRTPAEVVADTSRFSNTNQLPTDLRLRFIVTDLSANSSGTDARKSWYVSDATSEVTNPNSTNPTLMVSGMYNDHNFNLNLLSHSRWREDSFSKLCYGDTAGSVGVGTILADSGNGSSCIGNSAREGEQYNEAIDYALGSGSCTRYYRYALSHNRDNSWAMSSGFVLLKITTVDKSSLRSGCWNFVHNTELPINWYTTAQQNAYKLAIAKNFMALEVPGTTDTTLPVPDPNTATLQQNNRPGGVITAQYKTTAAGNAEIAPQDVINYKYGDDVYAKASTITGYSYVSNAGTWTDLGTVQENTTYNGTSGWFMIKNVCMWNGQSPRQDPDNKTVIFYYTPKMYHVSYDLAAPADSVTWPKTDSPLQNGTTYTYANGATYDASYTVQPAPDRIGYIFEGWLCSEDNQMYQPETELPAWNFDANTTFTAVWTAQEHTHTYVIVDSLEPTCTEDGYTTYACACGETYTDTIPAKGHTYDAEYIPPTCTLGGYYIYTCSVCGICAESDLEDNALGHDFDDSIEANVTIVPATTTVPGSKTVKCSRCDAVYVEELPIISDDEPAPIFIVSDRRTHPGETVKVNVSIQNNSGIIATALRLYYDPAVLTLTGVETHDLFLSGTFTTGNDLSAIPFIVLYDDSLSTANHMENGVFLTFTFTVKEDAPLSTTTVSITYDEASTYDTDLNEVSFETQNGTLQITERIAGDSSGDGQLNLLDVTLIRRYLVQWDGVEVDESCSDVNGDGEITLKDVTLIRRYLAGWNVKLI